MAIRPGDILHGKYRLDSSIGRGGMGQVFAATELASERQVAIKIVSRLLVDDIVKERMQREAEAAARIRSDYVPRVFEVSGMESGETFLVMERLIGESLSARIRAAGALPWEEVSRIGEDVLRGLIDAHTAGVIHRDLKPSNVFLTESTGRTRAMVLDFGVCKLVGLGAERLTGTGDAIGTVAYMAPEQIRGASEVDERADLYGFGVMVFEMVTGRLPHDRPSQMAILASKLENPTARLRDFARVPIPAGLDELIARCLLRDPTGRSPNAQELLRAWRALSKTERVATSIGAHARATAPADEAPTVVRPSGESPAPPSVNATQSALTAGTSIRRGGGTRVAVGLAATALVAGLVVVIVAMTRGPSAPVSAPIEAPAEEASATSIVAMELPPDVAESTPSEQAAPSGSSRHEGKKPRVRPAGRTSPTSQAVSKSSGVHITTQPRY